MKNILRISLLVALLLAMTGCGVDADAQARAKQKQPTTTTKTTTTGKTTPRTKTTRKARAKTAPKTAAAATQHKPGTIKKVLYIGDSMTGWLAERLGAYGAVNGFDVATVVWDGSTIRKWGSRSAKLKSIVDREKPDVVFVSLGLNELLEPNPEKRLGANVDNILNAIGNHKLVWIGPPTWPGKGNGDKLVGWLSNKLGPNRFYNSSSLNLARQSKTNPHPTRAAVIGWTDQMVDWLKHNPTLRFPSLNPPAKSKMVRGKSYTYLRMRDKL